MISMMSGSAMSLINSIRATFSDQRANRGVTKSHSRGARLDTAAIQRIANSGATSVEILDKLFSEYADRTAFGYCEPGTSAYTNITYAAVWNRVKALAAAWQQAGMVSRGNFVGISGFSSLDWATADLACTYSGAVTVPLPTNIMAEDVCEIIKDAECAALVISLQEVPALARVLAACTSIRTIIVMGSGSSAAARVEAFELLAANKPPGCFITTFEALLASGDSSAAEMVVPGKNGWSQDPIMTVLYTSGSSGRPKGAVYREHILYGTMMDILTGQPSNPCITLGFMPLNHLLGRVGLFKALLTGGQTYFLRSPSMSSFFKDLQEVRPTEIVLPPRVCTLLYENFVEELETITQANGSADAAKLRKELILRFRTEKLGGRIVSASTGGAPNSPDVTAWLNEVLGFPITNNYGSTEGGLMTLDGKIVPSKVLAYKLVDVPELGYTAADQPHPRGELRIKTRNMISEYHKDPKATAELFDEEGYLKTGDAMEQTADGTLVWIDRVKNILKLSQGEYVCVSQLEVTYTASSQAIRQLFIYGNSLRDYLLAVVVPTQELAQKVSPAELRAKVRVDIDRAAVQKALQGCEIPRDFIIEMEPFSKDNHLLTDSGKPATGRLKKKYGPALEALYAEQEARAQEQLRIARQEMAGSGSAQERVMQALAAAFGASAASGNDADSMGGRNWAQLGGDSMAAVQFARRVSNACGVNLPASFVLDKSHTVDSIIARVKELVSGGEPEGPTFQSVHSGDTKMIRASDLRLDRFLSEADMAGAAAAAPASQLPAEPEVVLLTGANGFLGRFLLLQLLERVADKANGRVIAVVRGSSDENAAQRLRTAYESVDADLMDTFDALSSGRLTVYAGDLAKPQFGLEDAVWAQLSSEVDTILHNGALVNHAFTYEQLFEPNVLGSVEVMRLALNQRKKALGFLSTVGVVAGLDHPEAVLESEDGPSLCSEHPGDGGYAVGYGCSKWAVEVLLKELHEAHGIPVTMFRCGMILSHSRFVGQINPTDFFTRLLCSIVYTGMAPKTFYAEPRGNQEHFDGLPVDFVSKIITTTALAERSGISTYHVVNPHWDDKVSLDAIVNWVESSGYKLQRFEDYGEWFRKFKVSLENLERPLQANSSLPIIHQWEKPLSQTPDLKFDAAQLRKKAQELTKKDIPSLDEAFVRQNLRHLAALKLISPPETPL
ncbi:Carboxylic acid reductase [Coccomyxa sp. Obi]|nr:Carboxylic acid reductase [Coccomyxa sp. Obi]